MSSSTEVVFQRDGCASPDEKYLLQWNNYTSSLASAFGSIRDREEFVDVTLVAGCMTAHSHADHMQHQHHDHQAEASGEQAAGGDGDGAWRRSAGPDRDSCQTFGAHKVILSACSPHLRRLLRFLPSWQHPVLVFQDVPPQDLEAILNFIYGGQVQVAKDRLASFLKSAEMLQINGLTDNRWRFGSRKAGSSSKTTDAPSPAATKADKPVSIKLCKGKMMSDGKEDSGSSRPDKKEAAAAASASINQQPNDENVAPAASLKRLSSGCKVASSSRGSQIKRSRIRLPPKPVTAIISPAVSSTPPASSSSLSAASSRQRPLSGVKSANDFGISVKREETEQDEEDLAVEACCSSSTGAYPEPLVDEQDEEHLVIATDPQLMQGLDPTLIEESEEPEPGGNSSSESHDSSSSSSRSGRNAVTVLFSEKSRCHFCQLLCPDRESLRCHLKETHQPERHALCENCENFFHVCAIQRHKIKCTQQYNQAEKKTAVAAST